MYLMSRVSRIHTACPRSPLNGSVLIVCTVHRCGSYIREGVGNLLRGGDVDLSSKGSRKLIREVEANSHKGMH